MELDLCSMFVCNWIENGLNIQSLQSYMLETFQKCLSYNNDNWYSEEKGSVLA